MSHPLVIMVGMCMICDGASRDEVLFHLHGRVLRHGWTFQGVGSGGSSFEWIYSIGLSGGFAHPELVMVGGLAQQVVATLDELCQLVRGGRRLDPGDQLEVSFGGVTLDEVHPDHLDGGLVAACDDYYRSLGGPSATQRVLQVVARSGPLQAGQPDPPRLSDPTAEIPSGLGFAEPRPNRAERRANARARPRPPGQHRRRP